MRTWAQLAVVIVALLISGAGRAAGPVLTAEDQTAFRAVITTQIEALRKDDFAAAYAVAAPSIKVLYPTVQSFTQVIRGRYTPLIRPKTVVFGTVTHTSQGPVQRVFLTANDGRAYVVNYAMQKQPDNAWLIAGHTISRDNSSSGV
jgi:hypothetical protein